MSEIPFPRGVRDLMPNEAIARNEAIEKIEQVYRSFGFLPIYTPYMESLDVLKAKDVIGEENKLIFELKEQNNGLRYDHTVGLARYISMHNSMPLPFKRYAIGTVWRMDEPQRMRLREFAQADVDILGGDPIKANAEAIAVVCKAMDALGLDYTIRLNSRRTVDMFMEKIGLTKHTQKIMRTMDKTDKIGKDGVSKELESIGLGSDEIDQINAFVGVSGTNDERIKAINDMVGSQEACAEISGTMELLSQYGIKGKIKVDPSIVRGIDYYTGIVVETLDNSGKGGTSSICSGGRYDNLVSRFSESKLPGVGMSIGIDRVLEVLGFEKSERRTYARAFVAYIKEQNYSYALSVANRIRDSGICVDLNQASRNISNQLSYASSLKIPYSIIVGDTEQKNKTVKLRDMESGEEKELSVEEAIKQMSK
ncbi:MAG: histidine--tRNA ligase [Candidatus Marsarchaeota archaeon]|nr:histidine--tRNA ligase [Candidatus Marsarchaeota archaeon]